MAPSNVEVVERLLTLVNAGDIDAAMLGVAPGAQLDWSNSEAPDRGVYHGPDRWRAWMLDRAAHLVEALFEATELVEVPPDRVVLVAYMRGRGRASGLEIDGLGAAICTLEDGQVTGLKLFQTREEAMAAAGVADG
jgi:ketosteroid isomerase-like protein